MLAIGTVEISRLTAEEARHKLGELAGLLHACVHDGASIGFILPFAMEEAEAYWTAKVFPGLAAGGVELFVAHGGGRIAGTVQLDHDTPRNQPHRAEVRKLLVHPGNRRHGIARSLMAELETRALRLGRTLLTLDTRTGDGAEPLYRSIGFQTAGVIPGFCRDTLTERLDSTTIMYKAL